jgi:phosphoglycerate kinase
MSVRLRTIHPQELSGKRVLLRVEVNVPHTQDGWPMAGRRLQAAARSVALYAQAGARVVVLAHRGEPKGPDAALSTERVAEEVMRQAALGARGRFLPSLPLEQIRSQVEAMALGDVLWLENLRFHPGECANSEVFAAELARLGDVLVNDAFGVLHRRQASVCALAKLLPTYAGPTVTEECAALERLRDPKEHPCIAVVGGGKLSTKLAAIRVLLERADAVFVGAGMAALFAAAEGKGVGATPAPASEVALARTLLHAPALRLPQEVLIVGEDGSARLGGFDGIAPGERVVDWGPRALLPLQAALATAALVFWNGPVGVVEDPQSRVGTDAVAQAIAAVGRTPKTYAVVGGGETGEAIDALGLTDFFDWVSTGGGAMLAYVGGESLPGMQALML